MPQAKLAAAGWALAGLFSILGTPGAAEARATVDASAPENLAVTLYRDPDRGPFDEMNRDWPRGFAMITETRQVTLPPGQSTIRFTGVAEGMVAVSAIVTGLPGGTIEKNRNADLLSPAALVDGTLGNRVTITRTNSATGEAASESAIVRTRADGGLVLQTAEGYEAVRCSGLPEKLTFAHVPEGLSPQPVFTIDTRDPAGGTYTVQLTYLAWGFDWQAHYVASLADETAGEDDVKLHLLSWLTLLNDNGQSFPDAELLVVAGKLNVVSDYRQLADPPRARPLQLTCYPLGSTADGTPFAPPPPPPPPPPPAPMMMRAADAEIVVTGMKVNSSPVVVASEEDLGDLKLYRVPERVTVSAKGMKQIAFLDRDRVSARQIYIARCAPWDEQEAAPANILLTTVNDRKHGLGVALPMGGITFFEPGAGGEQFAGEQRLRDYASGQDVEVTLGTSAQVFATCESTGNVKPDQGWAGKRALLTNANRWPVTIRLQLGEPAGWHWRGLRGTRVKDGQTIYETTIPANGNRTVTWQAREDDL